MNPRRDYATGNYPGGYNTAATQSIAQAEFAPAKILETLEQLMDALGAPVISEFRVSSLVDRLYQLRMLRPREFTSLLYRVQPWRVLAKASPAQRFQTDETMAFMIQQWQAVGSQLGTPGFQSQNFLGPLQQKFAQLRAAASASGKSFVY